MIPLDLEKSHTEISFRHCLVRFITQGGALRFHRVALPRAAIV